MEPFEGNQSTLDNNTQDQAQAPLCGGSTPTPRPSNLNVPVNYFNNNLLPYQNLNLEKCDSKSRNRTRNIPWGPDFFIDSVIAYLQFSWRRKIRPAKFNECLVEYFEQEFEARVKVRLEEHRLIIYPEDPENRDPNRSCLIKHSEFPCKINHLQEPVLQFTCKWGVEVVLSVMLYTKDDNLLFVRTSSKSSLFPDSWILPSQKLPIGIAIREAGFQILLYMIGYYNDWPVCDSWITAIWEFVDVKENLETIGRGNHYVNVFLIFQIPLDHASITQQIHLNTNEVTLCAWFPRTFLEALIIQDPALAKFYNYPKNLRGIFTQTDGNRQEFLIKPSIFLDGKAQDNSKISNSNLFAIRKMLSDIHKVVF